ncbi:amidase [Pseudonocardia sp. RS11V-5]|uniref:amidase n=1 Tax=Pseudonocardia terrae TaxID=2905831 RepID=UPI001E428857|nr:amidase [Pseudonocardia terrae]MCE3553597.1 amidase [Pseudonocardia terrae]
MTRTTDRLADLTARELLAGYRAGALCPVEVVDDVLARIETDEPRLHATYALDPDGARAAAAESAARWRGGEARPLDGVPITLKDNIATRGVPTPVGTAATELVPAERDAPAAARVREAGAVILGKTTMPDLGMLGSSQSSFHPVTRNPWDPTRTPGGSSSGAAAAAAAGYGPLHLGTDIGGSVRQPAGWNGIAGLKPTFGRVPVVPPYAGRVIGPLCRTVGDVSLLMSVVAVPDTRDHTALPAADIAWPEAAGAVQGLRIGLLPDVGVGLATDHAVRAAVEEAARTLEAAGAVVEPVAPFLTRDMLDGMDRFWRARAWSDLGALPEERRAKVLPAILEWAAPGADLTGAEVFHGYSQMDAMAVAAHRALAGLDFLLLPTAPIPPFPVEYASAFDDPARPFEHIATSLPFNMSGQPALSVNCGYTTGGLPIGLQIVGRRFDDAGVLALAMAYEEHRPAPRPWPVV